MKVYLYIRKTSKKNTSLTLFVNGKVAAPFLKALNQSFPGFDAAQQTVTYTETPAVGFWRDFSPFLVGRYS